MSEHNEHLEHKLHVAEESAKTLHYWLMLIESLKHISSLVLETLAVTFPIVSYIIESVGILVESIRAYTSKGTGKFSRGAKVGLSLASLGLMTTAVAVPPIGGILILIVAGMGVAQGVYHIQQTYQKHQQLKQHTVSIYQKLLLINDPIQRHKLFKSYQQQVHLQYKTQHRLIDHAVKTKLTAASVVGFALCVTPLAPVGVAVLLATAVTGFIYKWKVTKWIKKRLHNKAKKWLLPLPPN
jgi:hypothetical protein